MMFVTNDDVTNRSCRTRNSFLQHSWKVYLMSKHTRSFASRTLESSHKHRGPHVLVAHELKVQQRIESGSIVRMYTVCHQGSAMSSPCRTSVSPSLFHVHLQGCWTTWTARPSPRQYCTLSTSTRQAALKMEDRSRTSISRVAEFRATVLPEKSMGSKLRYAYHI